MAETNKFIIVYDLDKTLNYKKKEDESYLNVKPILENIEILQNLSLDGANIIIDTARNMLTQNNDESKVIKNVGLDTLNWLQKNNISYHGIRFGKPYASVCYVDDKALRPRELKKIYDSLENPHDLNELRKAIEVYLENN